MTLASVIFGLVFPRSLTTVAAVLLAAWLADWVIDRFGHKTVYTYDGDSHSSRIPVTHSIMTAPVIGLLVGLMTAYLLIALRIFVTGFFAGDLYDMFVITVGGGAWFLNFLNFNTAMALTGIATAVLHLLMDSLTESGIYTPFKRWAIANVSTRDPGLNITLKLASVLTITYVLSVRISFIGELFPIPFFVLPVLALGLLAGTVLTIVRHKQNLPPLVAHE